MIKLHSFLKKNNLYDNEDLKHLLVKNDENTRYKCSKCASSTGFILLLDKLVFFDFLHEIIKEIHFYLLN